jgi:Flp pilus assembly protein TadD
VKLTQGQTADAVADTKRATELAPNQAEAWHNHAAALDAAGNAADAQQAYARAKELKPGGGEPRGGSGRVVRDPR